MNKSNKIFIIFILMLVSFNATFSAPPEWIMTTPQSRDFYYFSGSFTADDKAKANNSAKAEVIGSILFMINSTVSASTSFDQVYTRSSRRGGDSSDSRLFKKIKTRGMATVSRLEFVKTEFEKTSSGKWTAYVLARLPKREVDIAIKQFQEMRERLKKLKTACVIIALYPDGEIKEIDALKSFIEKFYRETLGYNIVDSEIDYNALKGLNVSSLSHKLKQMLEGFDQLILGVVSLQEKPTKRTTKIGGTKLTTISATGTFVLRTIELNTMKIVENNDYTARGVSTRGERAAMDELISELKKQLEGDESSAGGRDSVFD